MHTAALDGNRHRASGRMVKIDQRGETAITRTSVTSCPVIVLIERSSRSRASAAAR
jgi:hypothetical protein